MVLIRITPQTSKIQLKLDECIAFLVSWSDPTNGMRIGCSYKLDGLQKFVLETAWAGVLFKKPWACHAMHVGWRLVLRTDSSAKVRWSSARTRPCMLALEGGLVHAIAKHAQGFRRVMCNFVVVY